MRKVNLCLLFSCAMLFSIAQPALVKEINQFNKPDTALAALRFLTADALMGRSTTRPEIHTAARYIAEQFRKYGLRELSGTQNYMQRFDLRIVLPPASGSFVIGNNKYSIGKDFLQARGAGGQLTAPMVFAGFGTPGEAASLDLKNKIVLVNMGENDSTRVVASGRFRDAKQKLFHEKGALAVVERYWQSDADWELPQHAYSSQRAMLPQDSMIPLFMVHDPAGSLLAAVKTATTATINTPGNNVKALPAENVMGWVEGTDPQLKNQFIVLSAHYDHIGVASTPKMENGKPDSIYNGTRDNAIGVTAVINAARYFAKHPAKRSILLIAFTGEEIGLLGSKYFAAHPPIGLEKLVFNLNIDNGGYNDTTLVNVVGLGRTSADDDMNKACIAYGLTLKGDPAPEMNLFDRSDNVSLAAKGIPAPTFGMGVKQLDDTIMRYYHQLGDEIGTIDLKYTLTYINAYILAAIYIADNPAQPQWKAGDKYEAAWKTLYGK